jgi:hypothetical protein
LSRIVFDIETAGLPWETWDEAVQSYLIRRGGPDADEATARERLGLSAPTGRIVAIGMMNPDTRRGGVYFDASGAEEEAGEFEEEGIVFRSGSEEEILRRFWADIDGYDQWITYNGRTFDIPYVMQRSLILGVPPPKNRDAPRYRGRPHCDLMDILSFFGATRPFSLSFWCRTLGITDPKEEGIDGSAIGALYEEGRRRDIARYCLGDVRATADLFLLVEERYLRLRSDWR